MFEWVSAILKALFTSVLSAWQTSRDKRESDAAHERASVAETANETSQTIAEIADDRSKIPPPPDDAAALAASLRARKSAAGDGAADT